MIEMSVQFFKFKDGGTMMAITIIAILFFVSTLAYITNISMSMKKTSEQDKQKGLTVGNVDENLIKKDTDKDGVPDWEEKLRGLDPNNPDTNNNGISDLEEIYNASKAKSNGSSGNNGNSKTDNKNIIVSSKAIISKTPNTEPATQTSVSNKKKEKPPFIFLISSKNGKTNSIPKFLLLEGRGFTKSNTIYVRSEDGKTLIIPFTFDLPMPKNGAEWKLPFGIYVKNKNGLSDVGFYTLIVK